MKKQTIVSFVSEMKQNKLLIAYKTGEIVLAQVPSTVLECINLFEKRIDYCCLLNDKQIFVSTNNQCYIVRNKQKQQIQGVHNNKIIFAGKMNDIIITADCSQIITHTNTNQIKRYKMKQHIYCYLY